MPSPRYRISVRFLPEELAQVRDTAQTLGLPVSTLLRHLSLAERPPIRQHEARPEVVDRLRRVGDRLNRMAWWSNTHKRLPSERKLSEVLAELHDCLDDLVGPVP